MKYYIKNNVNRAYFGRDTREEFIKDILKHKGKPVTLTLTGSNQWKMTGTDGAPSGSGYWNITKNSIDVLLVEVPPNTLPEDLFEL